jgi:exodeoxyribonuclease VII small subunit
MADESYSFTAARTRLEEIVTQVRKKDVSLETSLDLLEEGVRLASQCTELIDSADWDPLAESPDSVDALSGQSEGEAQESGGSGESEAGAEATSDLEREEPQDETE